jgi:hypothetical protein
MSRPSKGTGASAPAAAAKHRRKETHVKHAVWSPVGLAVLVSLLAALARGDDKAGEKKDPPPLNELEKKFQESLHEATLAGKWRLVKDGKLGEEKEDRYTIQSAAKVGDDVWMIGARIQYGGKDVTLPVPVKVLWAGDTPVISITKAGIPGLGTYSARVLFYDGYYTGTWSASDHAGFLSGVIEKAAKPAGAGEPSKQ